MVANLNSLRVDGNLLKSAQILFKSLHQWGSLPNDEWIVSRQAEQCQSPSIVFDINFINLFRTVQPEMTSITARVVFVQIDLNKQHVVEVIDQFRQVEAPEIKDRMAQVFTFEN